MRHVDFLLEDSYWKRSLFTVNKCLKYDIVKSTYRLKLLKNRVEEKLIIY